MEAFIRAGAARVAAPQGAGGSGRVGRWLLIDDEGQPVYQALKDEGAEISWWRRRALGEGRCTPWPEAGPFDGVCLRLCRARPELAMLVELAADRLKPGAAIWLYGGNDEGVKSAGKALAPWFEDVGTADTRNHCRLWTGRRAAEDTSPPRGALADWGAERALALPGGEATFVGYPGCFAHGSLDPATEMLLGALEGLEGAPGQALDFCCGLGVIAAGLRRRFGDAVALTVTDHDALSVHAAAQNVPGAQWAVGDGWRVIAEGPRRRFDLIVSNPPIHRGAALDMRVVEQLIEGAGAALSPGGRLLLVIQRQRPIGPDLERRFAQVTVLAEDNRFRVWCARGPR